MSRFAQARTDNPTQQTDTRFVPHAINLDKQQASMVADTDKPDVTFVVNSDGENVNIECNPGFYTNVAWATFSRLTPGFMFDYPSTSFRLTSVIPALDSSIRLGRGGE